MNTVQFHLIRNKLSVGDRVLWIEHYEGSGDKEVTGTVQVIAPHAIRHPLCVMIEGENGGNATWLPFEQRIKIVSHS